MTDNSERPSEISIDPRLIAKWFDINPGENIEISLPRIALDLLYVAIEKPYFVSANVIDMVTAEQRGDVEGRDRALEAVKDQVVQGINALRQFQSIIMATATDSELDEEWKVKNGAADHG